MTYNAIEVRSGLAAIAAVLALSSTPLAAQETTAPPDPVTETPANPPPVADPPAPEPSSAEPAAPEPEATEAKPAAAAAPVPTRRPAARARAAAPARPATPAPIRQPVETAAEPVPIPPPTAMPIAEPAAPPVEQPAASSRDLMADESLPVAGAAGLGLLALGGLGLALQRRRRRREEMEHFKANQAFLAEHPVDDTPQENEPVFARAGQSGVAPTAPEAAVRTDVPRTTLPNGFDLSRFGPHVRAAYLGPTPDNSSLSLKYRLRRAAAMDQRARLEAEKRPQQPAARPQPPRHPVWATNDEGFMFRKGGGSQPSKPATATTRH